MPRLISLLVSGVFLISNLNLALSSMSSGLRCDSYDLVKYRLTFIGDWSEEKFPKQYPKFRPHAQWSKMIGRTHNPDYNLWSIGNVATSAFKKFAQEATSDDLDKRETQGFNGVLDSFISPAVNAGIGETSVDVFAANTHSKLSAAIRLIPSPDWFVGVDTWELCPNGTWIYEAMLPLDPVDAGTDRGYTFTSPKWASRPRQAMHRITSKFPNHRANSFYYPELDGLPHIGYVRLELLTSNKRHKEHRQVGHTRRVDVDEDELDPEKKREELEEQQILHGEPLLPGGTGGGNDDEAPVAVPAAPSAPAHAPRHVVTLRKAPSAAAVRLRPSSSTPEPSRANRRPAPAAPAPASTNDDEDDEDLDQDDDGRMQLTAPPTTHRPAPKAHVTPRAKVQPKTTATDSNRLAADQSRPDSSRQVRGRSNGSAPPKEKGTKHHQQKPTQHHHRSHGGTQHRREKMEEKQDCQVGDWGPWSACSKTCGFGAQKRTRKVVQPPKNGRPCPALQQEKWCGSMRACRDEQKLFSWLQNENGGNANARGAAGNPGRG